LAALQADGLQLDETNSITIARQGTVNATASIGTNAAPLLVSAVAAGVGDATSQLGLEASGILGSVSLLGDFASIRIDGGNQGALAARGEGVVDLQATATNGDSTTSLGGPSGSGSADITGIRNTMLTIGASVGQVSAIASGLANLRSFAVSGDASSTAATTSTGILSDEPTGLQLGITLGNQGAISALASQKSVSSATSVAGQATSNLSHSSVALQSVQLTLGGSGQLRAEALTDLLNRSESVSGHASA